MKILSVTLLTWAVVATFGAVAENPFRYVQGNEIPRMNGKESSNEDGGLSDDGKGDHSDSDGKEDHTSHHDSGDKTFPATMTVSPCLGPEPDCPGPGFPTTVITSLPVGSTPLESVSSGSPGTTTPGETPFPLPTFTMSFFSPLPPPSGTLGSNTSANAGTLVSSSSMSGQSASQLACTGCTSAVRQIETQSIDGSHASTITSASTSGTVVSTATPSSVPSIITNDATQLRQARFGFPLVLAVPAVTYVLWKTGC
ncbi:hypothetical protein F4778DRAFT_785847 [Xylariomycetidae sp. FL2044]|nr:hypothetical protein F4778DRAFT_785847 [Xylariomycetidae sp. FL2044]